MVGRIIEYSRSIDGKPRITFEVDSFDELRGLNGELRIDVKENRAHRSLNANSYFHKLIGLMADRMNPPISKAKCKNLMMGKYGQREMMNEQFVTFSSEVEPDVLLEVEYIHLHPIGIGVANNKKFYHYAVLKPTHEYNTKEMAYLIDGTVQDAKELGVPTESPDEIERMKALWKSNQ